MLVVHVDDIVVVETVEKEVELKGPGREFKIKDLGGLKHFLRIGVARSKKETIISKCKYTLD